MTKSMYKSKSKREKATELQKLCSKFQLKVNHYKRISRKYKELNLKRKEQNRRDHKFIEILMEKSPTMYDICLREYEKRYGKDRKV